MGLLDYTISDKKYFNSGREYERERIIKLLEEHLGNMDWDDLVLLIKGNSKQLARGELAQLVRAADS